LWTVEASAVLLFVGLLLFSGQKQRGSPALEPIDPAAFELGIDAKEWFGVYFLDQKVGYAASSRKRILNGGEFVHTEAAYTMAAGGHIARSVMASTAVLDEDKRLSQFDFFLSAEPVRLAARGLFNDGVLAIDVYQGGEHQRIELPMEEPPHVGASLPAWVGEQELIQEGDVYTLPYFDPVSLSQRDMEIRVLGTEVLASGEEAYWLERDFGGASTKTLVLPNGETLREESAMGLSMRRESAEEARSMPAADEVVDVIALSG